jgi:hypothetical protein
MPNPTTKMRALTLLALGAILLFASCTPEQQAMARELADNPHFHDFVRAESYRAGSLSDAQLARLARCESGGDPTIVSASGAYHGLYQFNQRTWNGVAASVLPRYIGVAPSRAPAFVQDAMARALYNDRGAQPWPHCGRYL